MFSLRKSILVSACFHVGIFSAFFFLSLPGGARVLYKPQYQVRLVQPSELSSPVSKGSPPAPKPQSPPPSQKQVSLPEKEAQKPEVKKEPKVALKPAATPKPEKPPAPVSEKQSEAKKKTNDLQQEKALENVLARLRQKAKSRGKAEPDDSLEEPSGGPGAGWEDRQGDIRYHEYYDEVERRVRENWIPPSDLDLSSQVLIAVVSISLLPDGRVIKSYIEESSGDLLFDQSVMRALLKSTPLPPPPLGLQQDSYELGLRFHSMSLAR
jgi:colicin import membrane protein